MKIGDRLRPRIDETIRLYDKLLLVLSKTAMGSQWVEQEVETALARERQQGATILFQQNPKNLSRKGYAPIIREPRGVTWGACISVVFYSGDPSYADPYTALSR
jgi:hypothetical protein